MISSYSKKSNWLIPLIEHNTYKNILVVDWFKEISHADMPNTNNDMLKHSWNIETIESRVDELMKEADKYDFVLIVVREFWSGRYEDTYERNYKIWKDTDKKLISRGNIYFLTFSESFFYKNTTPRARTLSLPWFYSNWYTGGIFHSPTFTPDVDYVEKDYTFNMLLGKRNSVRKEIFDRLQHRKDIYKTYFGEEKYKSVSDIHLEDEIVAHYLINKKRDEELQTFHGLPVDYNTDFSMSKPFRDNLVKPLLSHTVPEKIYKNTHFDIITETILNDRNNNHTGWTTEKTGKPLFTGRFFVFFGCLNMSTYLKKFGYELDSYMLNDYNSEPEWYNRFDKTIEVINELENINYVKKVYNDTREARLHNMQVAKDGMQNSLNTIQDWIRDKLDE